MQLQPQGEEMQVVKLVVEKQPIPGAQYKMSGG